MQLKHPRGVVSVGNLVQFHELDEWNETNDGLCCSFDSICSTVQKLLAGLKKNVAK